MSDRLKATPGPWRLNGDTIVSNQSHPVATLSDPSHRQVEGIGTGHDGPLIAAAPDLYAALETFVLDYAEGWQEAQNITPPDRIVAARAALAKARGEA